VQDLTPDLLPAPATRPISTIDEETEHHPVQTVVRNTQQQEAEGLRECKT